MIYLKIDLKNLYKNKLTIVAQLFLLFIMVFSPVSMLNINNQWDGFAKEIGQNPFQFWLLMDSVGWGHAVYHALFWMIPVILTGLVYYNQKSSSMYEFLIVRGDKNLYFLSKAISQFLFSFVNMFLLLSVNVLVTYLIYPIDAPITEQYMYLIPNEGMFSRWFYEINPICMVVLYTFLNAFTIALLSVFTLAIQEIITFKNIYMAFLVPFIGIYVCNYIISMLLGYNYKYDLSIIIQPRSASTFSNVIQWFDVAFVFGVLILVDIAMLIIGYLRNREVC